MMIKYIFRHVLLTIGLILCTANYAFCQPWLEYQAPFDINLGSKLSEPYKGVDCQLPDLEEQQNFGNLLRNTRS